MTLTRLQLHEEYVLFALHDRRGTLRLEGASQVGLAQAAIADLLLLGRIDLVKSRLKAVNLFYNQIKLVEVINPALTGSPLLDWALIRFNENPRRKTVERWSVILARRHDLHHLAAHQMALNGILHLQDKVRFGRPTKTIYPEANPNPEQEVRERLREAIFNKVKPDDQTAILITLLDATGKLNRIFSAKDIRFQRDRLIDIAREPREGPAGKAISIVRSRGGTAIQRF